MKLAAVAQRGLKKDKDDGHLLVALTYFDDADRERTPILLHRHSWPVMKAAIRGWVSGTSGRR